MLTYFLWRITKEDLKSREIPDEWTLGICILADGLGGFSVFRLCFALGMVLLTSFVMGLGDAKLFGALTLVFGEQVLLLLCLSFLAGAVCSLLGLWEGDLQLNSETAFAPYIAYASMGILVLNMV